MIFCYSHGLLFWRRSCEPAATAAGTPAFILLASECFFFPVGPRKQSMWQNMTELLVSICWYFWENTWKHWYLYCCQVLADSHQALGSLNSGGPKLWRALNSSRLLSWSAGQTVGFPTHKLSDFLLQPSGSVCSMAQTWTLTSDFQPCRFGDIL